MSPAWLRTQALDPDGRWRLDITGAPLGDLLLTYAERAGVVINIERLPDTTSRTLVSSMLSGTPPLDLPDDTTKAVERIVALDSRYEWSEQSGRFLVRPKPGLPGRLSVLDTTIPALSATNEPAGDVIARVLSPLGSPRRSGGSAIGVGPNAIGDALATRIDVDRPGPLSIRDALNAIADVTGWMWSAGATPASRPSDVFRIEWRGRHVSADGARRGTPMPPRGDLYSWSVGFVISTAPAPPAPVTGPPPIPDGSSAAPPPVPRPYVTLPVNGTSLKRAVDLIARNHDALIGLEVVAPSNPESVIGRAADRIDLGELTMPATMARLQELATDYTITLDKDVYHVRPRDAQRDSTPWLKHEVPRFQQRFEHMRDVLAAVARLDWPKDAPAATVTPARSDRTDPLMKKPIALSLRNATIRDVLDEVARQHGAMHWVVEQRVAVSGPLVRVSFIGRGWSIGTYVR
jgi:hypothetical protein